nr:hypothetical protein [Tanacetum cinerariifolium]GFA17675.1 hypothetical protein [Tanacetum cinerariifolium]
EYHTCATGEAAPKPKASARKKKGGSASSTTPPTPIATPTPTTTIVAAPRLSAVAKDEGTSSKPGVPDVPSDDSEEELSWNSSDDEDVDEQTKGRDKSEGEKTNESDDDDDDQDKAEKGNDDNDDEEEMSKIGEQEVIESDEGLRIGEEERMHEEEEADELYRYVDINQGRGLQVSQETEDSHVILTPTQSDAQQESLSTSSFMTNLLNPTMDLGMESIFTTGSSTVTPIPSPQSTMTPSIISTFITASQLPTLPTSIPRLDLQNVPTFALVFHFEKRVKTLEGNFSNIPGNKSIQRSDEQRNLYKALVEAYDVDKTILDTYGESAILKRRREDDDQEGPSTGSDRESKDKEKEGSMHQPALHLNQLLGVQADLLQGLNLDSCLPVSLLLQRSLCRLPVRWRNPHIRCLRQEPINYDKHALWGVSHWGRKHQQFYGFAVNRESALDVYSKRRIIAVTNLKIVEWHDYKHLDWISVRKLSNLTVEERFAFNVSLRMFTRSIVIQRRVEDLQLGVESYQKRLNLTKPDTYRSDL